MVNLRFGLKEYNLGFCYILSETWAENTVSFIITILYMYRTSPICYKSFISEISLIGFQVAPGVGQFGGFKSNANWNM